LCCQQNRQEDRNPLSFERGEIYDKQALRRRCFIHGFCRDCQRPASDHHVAGRECLRSNRQSHSKRQGDRGRDRHGRYPHYKYERPKGAEKYGTSQVRDLPLSGPDPEPLPITTPGVILRPKTADTATPPGTPFGGAGTREIQNSLSLDGINIANNLITNTPTRVMVESVQEVEVQTGTYSAQYGSYMGVHINMITKSGTNQFHGAAVEFLRNQVLDP